MNELRKIHFGGSFVCMNLIFFPMFAQGIAGMSRRMSDGGASYMVNEATADIIGRLSRGVIHANVGISVAAFLLGVFQLPFIYNFFSSMFVGRKATL